MSRLGFSDDSALLKHELAYCLGQLKRPSALPTLEKVLRDTVEDPMVRHEVRRIWRWWTGSNLLIYGQAAEAMGAISSTTSIPILEEFLSDSDRAVRETCEIAIARINWENSAEGQQHLEQQKNAIS